MKPVSPEASPTADVGVMSQLQPNLNKQSPVMPSSPASEEFGGDSSARHVRPYDHAAVTGFRDAANSGVSADSAKTLLTLFGIPNIVPARSRSGAIPPRAATVGLS